MELGLLIFLTASTQLPKSGYESFVKVSKTKKEALELEQYIRVVELKEKRFDFLVTTDMLFDILEEEDRQNNRKISYISTQRNNYERHIKPYFINTNLNKLSYEHIFEFREYLKIKPKKAKR